MQHPQPYVRTLAVSARKDLDTELDQELAKAMEEAITFPGRGILVTRSDHRTFIIELTHEVPFGTTLLRDRR